MAIIDLLLFSTDSVSFPSLLRLWWSLRSRVSRPPTTLLSREYHCPTVSRRMCHLILSTPAVKIGCYRETVSLSSCVLTIMYYTNLRILGIQTHSSSHSITALLFAKYCRTNHMLTWTFSAETTLLEALPTRTHTLQPLNLPEIDRLGRPSICQYSMTR